MDVVIEKCSCGHPSCSYYGLSNGQFYQGTGFDLETAERIVLALEAIKGVSLDQLKLFFGQPEINA